MVLWKKYFLINKSRYLPTYTLTSIILITGQLTQIWLIPFESYRDSYGMDGISKEKPWITTWCGFFKTFVAKGHVKVFEIRKFIHFILEFIASNLRHSIFGLISDFLLWTTWILAIFLKNMTHYLWQTINQWQAFAIIQQYCTINSSSNPNLSSNLNLRLIFGQTVLSESGLVRWIRICSLKPDKK